MTPLSPPDAQGTVAVRETAIAICEKWLETFAGREIKHIPAHEYAEDAVRDLIDQISAIDVASPSPEALPASGGEPSGLDILDEFCAAGVSMADTWAERGARLDGAGKMPDNTRIRAFMASLDRENDTHLYQAFKQIVIETRLALGASLWGPEPAKALPAREVEVGGEPDMRRVCEALGFDPTNHHNAAKCPYCSPALAKPASEPAGGGVTVALAKIDVARKAIWNNYGHLAAREIALMNDAYDAVAALTSAPVENRT